MVLHIHTQGRINNHTVHSLYRIMVMATSVMGLTKMGNIVPSTGLEPTSLAFRANVLPLQVGFPDVTTIPMYTCLCSFLPQKSVQTTIII